MEIIYIIFGACLILANNTQTQDRAVVKNCPQTCLCTTENSELGPTVTVECGGRNLTSVPNTTFDKLVSLLDVSFNDLYTLEDNTFFQYESATHIYLNYCKLVDISEKTFQRLENLIFVDLSNNFLTSISPNVFKNNHRLHTLFLGSNDLSALQWNRTLLNGPRSLSFLDLHSCRLSNISSVTFSALPNLTIIDISRNYLAVLNFDTLSAHQQLQDVNLENNPFICGFEFQTLFSAMQSNLSIVHYRTLTCKHNDGKREIWTPDPQSSQYFPMTTPSVTPSHEPDTKASTSLKSSMTPSDKSEDSGNATVKPTTPPEEELNIIILTVIIEIIFITLCIFFVLCIFIAFRCYIRFGGVNIFRLGNVQNVENEERLVPDRQMEEK